MSTSKHTALNRIGRTIAHTTNQEHGPNFSRTDVKARLATHKCFDFIVCVQSQRYQRHDGTNTINNSINTGRGFLQNQIQHTMLLNTMPAYALNQMAAIISVREKDCAATRAPRPSGTRHASLAGVTRTRQAMPFRARIRTASNQWRR